MKEKIAKIKETSIRDVEKCESLKELADLNGKYLGKKGE